ncbi:MAG: IMP cyclohydrolase [Oscillospiraceae bacterium]|jgi:IMP cyclohydrolase|nr:IMP cyclohydrolase [Oscillospiraceae bacterium]
MAIREIRGGARSFTFTEFLEDYLSRRRYPGRGIILGQDMMVYFITGRSENTRNRVLRRTMDGLRTEAFDPEKLTDPSLVIYNAVRRAPNGFVVTNGSQTDDVLAALMRYDGDEGASGCFTHAVYGFSYEPDPPLYTPRISGYLDSENGVYELAIARSYDAGSRVGCERAAWTYDSGDAHFISTYDDDGDPPPSFTGEPIRITDYPESSAELAELVWNALDRQNRIALYALFGDNGGEAWRDVIINAREEEQR